MSVRFSLVLVLVVSLACLAFVVEGRLLDPAVQASSEDTTEPSHTKTTFVSTKAASSKLESFVNSTKLQLHGGTMCEHINPDDLPEECYCRDDWPFNLVIECLKTFNSTYFNDTIGMKIDLDPCNEDGAKLSLDVTEMKHHIEYPIAGVRAGESKNIPIPGLAMIVPGIGNVGVDVAVLIAGNPDMLRLKVGLNACAQLSTDHQLCASSIPGVANILPWYILKGTYSFGDVCQTRRAIIADAYAHADGSADDSSDSEETAILIA